MVWRPFYFANLIVDPKDENKVYKPDLDAHRLSTTAARASATIGGGAHGDFHDVWIDPDNTDHLITGDDGGVWYSYDGGNTWWKAENLPISQFYHVSVDMDMPYNVYGGLQDNSSWVGDLGVSRRHRERAVGEHVRRRRLLDVRRSVRSELHLRRVAGRRHRPRQPQDARDRASIQPLPGYKEGKLRFNWNTPIHLSPTQKGTIYIGAQFLFRSRDHGQTWERISPDLTTNDPEKQKQEQSGGVTVDNSSAEMHTTIYAICRVAEGPERDLGRHRRRQRPAHARRRQDLDERRRQHRRACRRTRGSPRSRPGHFDDGTAYATFDLHTFGDMRPYVYRTTDFGKTWTPLCRPRTAR